jgi:TolA-binding protein
MLNAGGCAYFNTYYNAQKLYKPVSKKHQQFPDTTSASVSEKDILNKAIDKFAYVALKYPNSRWVLPSLYNMGNSYYLRGEYDKASRKYQEIWQYYPDSKYSVLSQLNNAVISYNLKLWDKARWEISQIKSSDKKISRRAEYLEALILQNMPDYPKAVIAWERFLFNNYKTELTLSARYNYAYCLFQLREYNNSIRELILVLDSGVKKDFHYQVSMLLGKAYQSVGNYDEAMASYKKIIKRETIKERISQIELEMANCNASTDSFGNAIRNYISISNKYPKTPVAAGAFFRIAQLYEMQQNLDSALAYYNKSRNENQSSSIREIALKRSADLSLLLAYRQQSNQQALEQSAKLQFLMAEHYLFSLNQPDSAVSTYHRVASNFPDQPLAPKAWYAAAWTAREYLSDTIFSDSLFNELVERYPKTRYANGARQILGLPLDTLIRDHEPDIEINLKPLETNKIDQQTNPPDSAITPEQTVVPVGKKLPEKPKIPKPDFNTDNPTR